MKTSTYWTPLSTLLGDMVLAANDRGLCGAWFTGQRHFDGPAIDWQRDDQHPMLRQAGEQLHAWFEGQRQTFTVPLAPVGTVFQQAVWDALARIPMGQTLSYGELAAMLGRPSAARAVGTATGRNPLSLIVPCHRLVGRDGALTGYAGGLARKQALLAFEAGDPQAWQHYQQHQHQHTQKPA